MDTAYVTNTAISNIINAVAICAADEITGQDKTGSLVERACKLSLAKVAKDGTGCSAPQIEFDKAKFGDTKLVEYIKEYCPNVTDEQIFEALSQIQGTGDRWFEQVESLINEITNMDNGCFDYEIVQRGQLIGLNSFDLFWEKVNNLLVNKLL